MLALELLAEAKIAEAVSRGELRGLPGEGRPLALDDDPLVPEDLRLAYRILKNAGFIPPQAQALAEIRSLEQFVERCADEGERAAVLRKIALLRTAAEFRTAAECRPGRRRRKP